MKIIIGFIAITTVFIMASGVLADEPPTFTVAEIQQYQGVTEGMRVKVIGVATCESARFGGSMTYIADFDGGPWAGIGVYDSNQRLDAVRGDIIEAVGVIQEYYDKTELSISDETEFPPLITGTAPVPPAIELTTGQGAQEQYESCLVRFRSAQVISTPSPYGDVSIDDGSGEFMMKLAAFIPEQPIGYVYECLAGIDDFTFGQFEVRPRDSQDLECPPDCLHTGDVNDDGTLTPQDALQSFQIYLYIIPDPTSEQNCAADCNGNGSITPEDALCIYYHYLNGSCDCMDAIQ